MSEGGPVELGQLGNAGRLGGDRARRARSGRRHANPLATAGAARFRIDDLDHAHPSVINDHPRPGSIRISARDTSRSIEPDRYQERSPSSSSEPLVHYA